MIIDNNCPWCNKNLIIEPPGYTMSQDCDWITICDDINHNFYASFNDYGKLEFIRLELKNKNYIITYNLLYGWLDLCIGQNHKYRQNFNSNNIKNVLNFLNVNEL